MPFWVLWAVPTTFLCVALEISIGSLEHVSKVHSGYHKIDKSCTFNLDEWNGIVLERVVLSSCHPRQHIPLLLQLGSTRQRPALRYR